MLRSNAHKFEEKAKNSLDNGWWTQTIKLLEVSVVAIIGSPVRSPGADIIFGIFNDPYTLGTNLDCMAVGPLGIFYGLQERVHN